MGELGTHLATERAGVVTLHLRESAPQLYADYNCGLLKGQKTLVYRYKSILFPPEKYDGQG